MKNHLQKMLLGCLSLLILAGCIVHTPQKKTTRNRALSMKSERCGPERMALFQIPLVQPETSSDDLNLVSQAPAKVDLGKGPRHPSIQPSLGKERDWKAFTVRKLIYPSAKDSAEEVVAYFYQPPGRRRFPTLIILPITHGDYYTEHLAHYLAERGFGVLRFESRAELMEINETGREALEQFKDYIRFYVADILRGIDWLQSRPRVHKERLGILGISQGAIVGSLMAGLDSRIKAGVFVLGGGGLAGILQSSEESGLIRMRKNVLRSGEISTEFFYQEAEEVFTVIDPLTYAGCIRPSKILFIDALYDRVIQPRYADQLWEQMGRPSRIRIPAGHYTAGLFLPYIRARALWHFQEALGIPP